MRDSYYDVLYRAEERHWWYRVRREMIHYFIGRYKKEKKLAILDMGCGTGALLGELTRYGEVSGMDFSEKAVNFARERGMRDVILGRAESLPFESDKFDVVLALDVLEHVEQDGRAIQELYRVLKPGGIAIIFVPAFMFLWGVTDEVSQHFRRYTKPELVGKVSAAGFDTLRVTYFNFFLLPLVFLVRAFNRRLPEQYKPEHETDIGSGIMNGILYTIFKFESWLLRVVNYPFGVSVALVGRKPNK